MAFPGEREPYVFQKMESQTQEVQPLWIAEEDVVSAVTLKLPPFTTYTIEVLFPDGSLPNGMTPFDFLELQDQLGHSTRSRLAQSGVDTGDFVTDGESMFVHISNYSARSSKIIAGEGITHIHEQNKPSLEGTALESAILHGKIIVGETLTEMIDNYGVTWHFFGEDRAPLDQSDSGNAKGIAVAMSPQRLYIPYKSHDIDVLSYPRGQFRRYLETEIFEELPEGQESTFVIAESLTTLHLRHHTLIDPQVTKGVFHINSLLFEGGRNGNGYTKKRFEFVQEPGAEKATHVRLSVYPAEE